MLFSNKIVINFYPNKGIDNIQFGTTRNEVKEILKEKYKQTNAIKRGDNTDCYFSNSLQFSFDDDQTLSFIEVTSAPPAYMRLMGIDTWKISGEELIKKIKEKDVIDTDLHEFEDNPIFKNLLISFYELDEQYDRITNGRNPKWGAIGIGDQRYYNKIKETNKNYG